MSTLRPYLPGLVIRFVSDVGYSLEKTKTDRYPKEENKNKNQTDKMSAIPTFKGFIGTTAVSPPLFFPFILL